MTSSCKTPFSSAVSHSLVVPLIAHFSVRGGRTLVPTCLVPGQWSPQFCYFSGLKIREIKLPSCYFVSPNGFSEPRSRISTLSVGVSLFQYSGREVSAIFFFPVAPDTRSPVGLFHIKQSRVRLQISMLCVVLAAHRQRSEVL